MIIPATEPSVRRGLNFSGDQRRKVLSEANSSIASPRRVSKGPNNGRVRETMDGTSGMGMEEKDDRDQGELPRGYF